MVPQIIETAFGRRLFYDVEQNTADWYDLRAGIPTASSTDKIVTPKKMEFSKSAEGYIDHLIAERMVGSVLEFQSEAMRVGQEREEESRKVFERTTGMQVRPGGFWTTEDGKFGASPDGLTERTIKGSGVIQRGNLELKNPNAATHIRYLRTRAIDAEYWIQILTQQHCGGFEFTMIQSYYPDLPSVILTVERDAKAIETLIGHFQTFSAMYDAAWAKVSV